MSATNVNSTQYDGDVVAISGVNYTVYEYDQNGKILKARVGSAPADGIAGFSVGAEVVNTAGDQNGIRYINRGTTTSAIWMRPGLLQMAEVSITNAEMLALRATPKTLVAAPGAGKVLEFVSAVLFFDYTGAYTETADNLAVKYTDGSGAAVSETIETTGFLDATADTMTTARAKVDAIVAKSGSENKALVLHNIGDGEFGGGNAANQIRVKVLYRVHTTGF